MKKFLIIFIVLLVGVQPTFAKEKKIKPYKFDGKKFELLYSKKTDDTYINEYYKELETYNNWTEMIALHQFTNAESPIMQVKELKKYLDTNNCKNNMEIDYLNNKALIEFVMESKKRIPVIIEYNVFKYKMTENGVLAVQYAKRYVAKTAFEQENANKDIEKNQKKIIKKVTKAKYPELIAKEVDKCYVPSPQKEVKETTDEKTEEKTEEIINAESLDSVDESTVLEEKEVKGEISDETDSENNMKEEENEDADSDMNTDSDNTLETQEETIESKAEEIQEDTKPEGVTENNEEKIPEQDSNSSEESISDKEQMADSDNNEEVKPEENTDAETKEISQEKVKTAQEENREIKTSNVEKPESSVVQNNQKEIKQSEKYKLVNDKKDFYAEPRDYKKIRKEHEEQIKAAKKAEKIKNNPKKRAKAAAKKLTDE